MIEEEIRKYILEGKWENQYPSAIEYLLEEVKRLREEVKVLSKYRDIVTEFDDALLADGDTDIRWSAIYDERVFE